MWIRNWAGPRKSIEDLSRYPDWTLQIANVPAAITCTVEMAEKHPELAVAFMKGMIKVGRWANEHKHASNSRLSGIRRTDRIARKNKVKKSTAKARRHNEEYCKN
jgi:ABC-type nitrate/sulfonate/bicarbonate transport system substrate-binding protein